MNNQNKLLNLVADLVEMLVEYGADESSIIETLKYYGITEEECKEWYGLSADDEEDEEEENDE